MRVVIAGGSGFLGRALCAQLSQRQHKVIVLSREPRAGRTPSVPWNPDGTAGAWAKTLDGADAVVNLAGANIAGQRWTTKRKALLRDSRILSTRSLVAAIGD